MDSLLRSSSSHHTGDIDPKDSTGLTEGVAVLIEEAEYRGDYLIALRFSNGTERTVDFKPFLSQSLNPLIRRYLEGDIFKNFQIIYGDLVWGDYDLCFPIADLYEGTL